MQPAGPGPHLTVGGSGSRSPNLTVGGGVLDPPIVSSAEGPRQPTPLQLWALRPRGLRSLQLWGAWDAAPIPSTAGLRSPTLITLLPPRPALLALLLPMAVAQLRPEPELDAQWDLWKRKHSKQYNGKVWGWGLQGGGVPMGSVLG